MFPVSGVGYCMDQTLIFAPATRWRMDLHLPGAWGVDCDLFQHITQAWGTVWYLAQPFPHVSRTARHLRQCATDGRAKAGSLHQLVGLVSNLADLGGSVGRYVSTSLGPNGQSTVRLPLRRFDLSTY